MPCLLNHCSTITLPFYTAHSTQSFCPIAPVGLRCQPPHRVIVTAPCGGEINGKNRTIICMANPRRVQMVAQQIRRELSDMLLKDKVLQFAVLPEAALGADRYLSSLTTISDVEVSADLQVVKVYVSVFGDERGREVAVAGLKSKAKYVRGQLGKRMKLRLTPEVRFVEDESLERGSRVITILDRIKDENKEKAMEDGDHQPGEFADASNDVDVVERESGDDASNDVVGRESGDVDDEGIIHVE